MPLTRSLLAGLVLAAAGWTGCTASGELGAEPAYGVDAPPTTSRVRSEQEYLDAGFRLEMDEKWASALAHYGAVINGTRAATPRLTAQCALRAAQCHTALEHPGDAVALLEGMIHDPYIAPDEDFPALRGGAGASLRIAAETRLRELGGDPAGLYGRMLAKRDPGRADIAVIALARIGDTFAKEALEKAVADTKLDAEIRDMAAAELKVWGSRTRGRRITRAR